jgi:hypothetical protein
LLVSGGIAVKGIAIARPLHLVSLLPLPLPLPLPVAFALA